MIRHAARNPCKQQADEEFTKRTRIQQDIDHLQEWLVTQRGLKVKADHQELLKFLCGCKFSLQRAKEKLEMSYRIRALAKEYFANRDPLSAEIQEYLNEGNILVLPDAECHSQCKTLLIRDQTINYNILKSESMTIKILTMILDVLLLKDDTSTVTTLQLVIDMKHVPHKCIMNLTPSFLKKIIIVFQSIYPIALKSISIINSSKYFETVFCWLRTFVGGKIKDRIHFYTEGSFEAILQFVPLSILPREYGGEANCINDLAAEMKEKIENNREWFMQDISSINELNQCEMPVSLLNSSVRDCLRKLDLDYQEYVIYCKQKHQSDQDKS